ncbi:cardiomyopathy-associated protein 5 [Sardina pilchardus]|uniref:cardiomyopathy-associated protein 5 n=1 Tax=Sardina pilchardus TaxID=27697 RepID=UPI002E100A3D
MDTTSKEESEPMEPEIQALPDEASGTVDVDDEDEIEELHNSLKEVVKDPAVKPKLQCLMVDPSFSMVTVQSEDSGIVWETASSRCSTPWASEGSSPSDSHSLESSGAQGKITVIMDDTKIVRKRKKSGRSKLGDRFKRPSSRMAAYGTERPAMAEVSVPNVKPENDEPAELKVDKDQELFSLISEGYEILNIVVPSKLPTVDEEEAGDLVDNLSYLQHTPKIKSKTRIAPAPDGDEYQGIIVQEIIDGEKEEADTILETGMKDAKKEGSDEDYLDKFRLVDKHALSEQSGSPGVPIEENIIQVPEQTKPQEESKSSPSNIEDSFVIITDNEIACEHMDEVFYANTGTMADEKHKGGDEVKDEPRSLKDSGSALFGSQETILIPVFLPEGPPKIIDPVLLEEPRAMSFLYTDLYDEAMGSRKRDDDRSDVESTVSDKSYKKIFSDDDEEDEGYLEKFILKDETPVVQELPEVADDVEEGERIIWPQNKFELTGCLKRAEEDSGGEKTGMAATEQMKDSETEQPVDTGKQEEISQGPITKAPDESEIEQEKEDVIEACVGNHCELYDAGKIIPESPESDIQNDVSDLLLEERAETVEDIKKHDGMSEMAKDLKETESEMMEMSGTVMEKSTDLLNEGEQPVSEKVIQDTIQEPVTPQDLKKSNAQEVSEKLTETPTIIEEPSLKQLEGVTEIQSDVKISEEPVNEATEVEKSDEIVADQATADTTSQVKAEEAISIEKAAVPLDTSAVIATAPETMKDSEVSVVSEEHLTDSVSQIPDEVAGGIKDQSTDTIPEGQTEIATVPADVLNLEDVSKSLPEVLKQDATEQEVVTDTLPDEKIVAMTETEMPSTETPGVEVLTVEDTAARTPSPSAAPAAIEAQEMTPEDQKEGEPVEEQAEKPEEMPSTETPGVDVLTVEDTAARTPSPSAAPAPIEVQEMTPEDQKEGEPVEEQAEKPEEMPSTETPGVDVLTVEDTVARTPSPSAAPAPIEVQEMTPEDQKEGEPVEEQVEKPEEMPSTETPGVEVLTVEDTAARTPSPSAAPAPIEVQEMTPEDQKEGEPVEEQAEEPEDEKSVAIELQTVEDDLVISAVKDIIDTTEQLPVECPHSEVQEQKGAIQEQAVDSASQTELKVSEHVVEPDRTVEKSEATEQHQEMSPALQANVEVTSTGPEPDKVEESQQSTDTPVGKVQDLTEELVVVDKPKEKINKSGTSNEISSVLEINPDIVCDVHEPKKVENKKFSIEFSVSNTENIAEATVEKNKHRVEQTQKKTTRRRANVPIIEVVLSKVPYTPGETTERQLFTSKSETSPVASEPKDSEEPVTRTAEGVTSVPKDVKQDVSLESVLPQTEVESNKQTVQEPLEAEEATRVAELERLEPEVRETQALAEPKVEVDLVPETVNEESKVHAEVDGVGQVTQDDTQAIGAVEPDATTDVPVLDKIVNDAVAEHPSDETQGPEAVIVEKNVLDETVNDLVAEIPVAETQGPEVFNVEEISVKIVEDVVAEIPPVEVSGEVLIVESKVSDETVTSVVAEIPSVETPGPEFVSVETKESDETVGDVVAKIPSVEPSGPEVITVENKAPDQPVNDVVAEIPSVQTLDEMLTVKNIVSDKTVCDVEEIPSVETVDDVLTTENKVTDQIIASVAEIPSVEPPGPEGVSVEIKVSHETVGDVAAEIPSVEPPGPDVVTVEVDKTLNDVVAEIHSVETPKEVAIVENKISDQIDVVEDIPLVEATSPEIVVEEIKVSDKNVSDILTEIPMVETPDEVSVVESKVSDQIDVVADISLVESISPEVVVEEAKVSDEAETVNDIVTEITSVEMSDEVSVVESKVSDQIDVADIPLVEPISPEVVVEEAKVSDETETVNYIVTEIPSVETSDEVLIVESKVLDQIDVVADISLVEPRSPEVVVEEAKVSDKTVSDKVAEIPSAETPDEVSIVESKVLDQIDVADIPLVEPISPAVVIEEAKVSVKADVVAEMPSVESTDAEVLPLEDTAVRTPSPSAAPAPIEVQEATAADRKEGEEPAEEPEGLLFSPLRSFSPKEDLSVLPEPEPLKEYHDEMAEELGYEVVPRPESREYPGVEAEVIPEREEDERFLGVDASKALEEEAAEDVLEADYEFIEESESVELSEEDQAKMQALDAFCLVCQCPVLMMQEHQNHEVCSLDRAYELLKDRLSNWISTLQERSENIEDMVSEIELAYNSVEEQCKMNEEAMDDQNEEMLRLVMDQYNEMSHTMEEEKKAKLEKLYDQIVSFQESIDVAKETLEKNSKEEEEEDPVTFVSSSKDINMSLTTALESTMSLELGPRGLSVFDDYAKGSGNGQKHRKGIPVPQNPHLQPQEANSATSTSVTVYWKVNEGDIIDCFQVYCMEDPQGAISEEYRVTVKESYCTLEELDPDKCYKVWVMAVNYTGCSLPSERLSFKTAPSVPVIQPEQCTVLWDSATLRWSSEQPSAAESYTLEYCRQYACEGEGLRSFSGIQGCEQRVLLQPNENYLFYIKAVNSAGASEQSEAALISTRGTRFSLLKETGGPALRLSDDKTTVLYSQDSFNEMAPINECPAILGELLPLKGYYYWETVVSGCPSYRLGIAYRSNPSDSLLGENSTSWCLHCVPTSSSSRFELLHNSVETDIFVVDVPTRVGTLLDFAQGRLVFINAQNGHLLGSTQHRFTEACHAAFGLESPGCLNVHMLPEVPEFVRQC